MTYSSNQEPDDLTALTALDAGDVFVVGDVSDSSEVAKKISKANLITDLGASFAPVLGADDNYVTDAEKANLHAPGSDNQDLSGYSLTSHAHEGTAILSTGEAGGTKYLREDGDGTCSWQTVAGGGNVSKVGTPVDNQVGVWTGNGTIEGTAGLTFSANVLRVGTAANGTVQSNGNFDLILKTGNATTGSITIKDGASAYITVAPNGVDGAFTVVNSTSVSGESFTVRTGVDFAHFEANGGSLSTFVDGHSEDGNTYITLSDAGPGSSGPALLFQHLSASPAVNDVVGRIEFKGKDSGAGSDTYSEIKGVIVDPTAASEDGKLVFATKTAGTATDELELIGTSLYPTTNDGLALGNATNQFSDLFLAEGAVINFDNGDLTLTQTGNTLALDGGSLDINGALTFDTGAVASDLNTGTDTTKPLTSDAFAGSNFGIRYIGATLNGTTALTTSEKAYFRIPAAYTGMNLVSVRGTVGTGAAGSSSSGTPTFTVKNVTDNNQMLSTSLTIDANEYTSVDATTAAVIDTTKDDVVTDDLIEIACTTAGTGVTYAQVVLGFQLP